MQIKIRPIDISKDEEVLVIVKWQNDPFINHLLTPRSKTDPIKTVSLDSQKQKYLDCPEYTSGVYMIFDGDLAIGGFNLSIDSRHIFKNHPGTSWLGLTIREKQYWGTGVARQAMDFFEAESKRRGANRAELGTFEFNHRAIAFYKKLGYREFARISDFTYWNGRFWNDIRMEKNLL